MESKGVIEIIFHIIIIFYIVFSTIAIGLNIGGFYITNINMSEVTQEAVYIFTYQIAFSNSIKNDSFTRSYVRNETRQCNSKNCIIRTAKNQWDKIRYTQRYGDVPDLKTLKKERNNEGRCVAQAMATATILAHHEIPVRYVFQKGHICVWIRGDGLFRCTDEKIRYISPTLSVEPRHNNSHIKDN